jgi:hypothetical protein
LYRIATYILTFEGDSHVDWFEGNFAAYEKVKKAESRSRGSMGPRRPARRRSRSIERDR